MNTEAEAIAALARDAIPPTILKNEEGREFLLHPASMMLSEVSDEHGLKATVPGYVSQNVTLQTRDSLVEYVNRFKKPATMLFADQERSTIVAVVDYHKPGDDENCDPDHAAHRASMVLPFSQEWMIWTSFAGKMVGQLEFARFMEENAAEVVAPDAATLIETVRDIQAHRKVNFTKAVRTASNNENFEFTQESEARTKGGIELPTQFVLNLPVYFGEPMTELRAFLRWEISDEGGLKLGIQLHRAEHVRQACFRVIATEIAERTQTPVVYGRI